MKYYRGKIDFYVTVMYNKYVVAGIFSLLGDFYAPAAYLRLMLRENGCV